MSLATKYSGLVLNQNQAPEDPVNDFLTGTVYQNFFMPPDFARGSGSGQVIPQISGFQVLVSVTDAIAARLTWTFEHAEFGSGWRALKSGTVVGADRVGGKVWVEVMFDAPVTIPADWTDEEFRIKLTAGVGIDKIWYSVPTPISGYVNDGTSPILDNGRRAAVVFRLLGTVADTGTDFLGNIYRSVARTAAVENASTSTGQQDASWLSKPNPSRFAVECLYFDVRKRRTPTSHGTKNIVTNPSFEIDTSSWAASGNWIAAGSTLTRDATTGVVGSARMSVACSAVNQGASLSIPSSILTPAVPYTVTLRVLGAVGESFRLSLGSATGRTFTDFTGTGGWQQVTVTHAGISATESLLVEPQRLQTGAGTFYVDAVLVYQGPAGTAYFDGDTPGCVWLGQRHNSVSAQVIQSVTAYNSTVVDRVLVDPLTPGVFFSVYYSSDPKGPGTDSESWDNLLWSRVPKTYQAKRRETHALPEPISANYIKIEFTHLQAQHYSPGGYQKPITFRKHPKWVLDYFLLRLEESRAVSDDLFVPKTVGVQFDALDLAYNYYLDDLAQEPDAPVRAAPSTDINSFLAADDLAAVDPTTLDQIRLVFNEYRSGTATFAKTNFLPSSYSQALAVAANKYTEGPLASLSTNSPTVSTLDRDAVVIEQSYPVMYFFLPCRHGYRVTSAPLSHDRAYFVGVREIQFERENYATRFDQGQYVESVGDLSNVALNDFALVNNAWQVYDPST